MSRRKSVAALAVRMIHPLRKAYFLEFVFYTDCIVEFEATQTETAPTKKITPGL
jgi:hypothetical protein